MSAATQQMTAFETGFRAGLRPDPVLTVSQWADRHRRLSKRASAEHGEWRTSRTPYLKEPMDCLSARSGWERVALMFGAQLGKTETGNNWIGYTIHHSPGPMLAVMPTVEMAKRNSKQRIEPLIEETPALRMLVTAKKSRDSGNTILQKDFPGGTLVMTGANSAVGLRSMAAGKLFLDEVDAYPGDVDGEGDPIQLATARARTFSRRKILLTSTPTIAGRSKIETVLEESDQRRYHVPCPHCGHMQPLIFGNLRWDKGQPASVRYVCASCGDRDVPGKGWIYNHEKTAMLAAGKWIANPGSKYDGKTAGFYLSSLYSPVGWFSWEEIALAWEQADDDTKRKVFINTILGETWRERGEAPEWTKLKGLAKDIVWPEDGSLDFSMGLVPRGALFLTCSVDIQADRIEVEIRGWGRRVESWSILYEVIQVHKVTSEGKQVICRTNEPEPWQDLASLLAAEWPCAGGGTMPIWLMGIDTGYSSQEVYDFCLHHPQMAHGSQLSRVGVMRTVVPIKGGHSAVKLVEGISPTDAAKKRHGLRIVTIGASAAKQNVFDSLWKAPEDDESKAGVIHFPLDYGEEYFKGLCSEERFVRKDGTVEFRKRPNARNEPLDLAGYNRALAELCGISRFTERDWIELERRREVLGIPVDLPADPSQRPIPPPPPPQSPPVRRPQIRLGGF